MSRNNTGNPIGSKAYADFEDNVKNLDVEVNSDDPTWADRFQQVRLTYAGMQQQFSLAQDARDSQFQADQLQRENEFDAAQDDREQRFNTFIASSVYQNLGDYGPGIEFTEYNQLVRDESGEFWRVSGQVDLPYVTTGDGIPEGDALVPAGDAVLRQDLANLDKGAAMVARGVIVLASLAELHVITPKPDQLYAVNIGRGRSVSYRWRPLSTAKPDGIAIVAPDPYAVGRFIAENWVGNEYISEMELVPFSGKPITRLLGVIAGKLVGASGTSLYHSEDAGETWALLCDTGVAISSDASGIYELDNGEVLLNVSQSLYVSSGWDIDPSTATFTLSLSVANPAVERFHPGWGVSTAGSYVYVCEYGNPKPAAFNGYLSKDYGQTFVKVFDLRDHWPENNNSHNHGCCVDPWHNNRLWQLTADTPTIGAFYSDDDGVTWTKLADGRFPTKADGDMGNYVTLVATEHGIVCGTDTEPNGIAMILRDGDYADNPRMVQIHTFIDGDQTLTHVAQYNTFVGDVVYTAFGQVTGNSGYPSRITATHPETQQSWLVWEDPAPAGDARRLLSLFASEGHLFGRFLSGEFLKLPLGQGRSVKGNEIAEKDTGWVLGGKANTDQRSLAVGINSTAGIGGTAVGQYALAGTNGSVAVGRGAQATAAEAVAIGSEVVSGTATTASGVTATAIGPRAVASGQASVAIGLNALADESNAVALGTGSDANGAFATAVGYQAQATSTESLSVGRAATSGNRGSALGTSADASGQRAVAAGHSAVATSTNSTAVGSDSSATHSGSVAIGYGTATTKTNQVAIGGRELEVLELPTGMATPAEGAARIYLTLNGGNQELRVRFANGQDKVIASSAP